MQIPGHISAIAELLFM